MTGKELRKIRHRLGLTQGELAEKIGVARNTVLRWELGLLGISEPIARLVRYVEKEVSAGRQKKKKTRKEQ